MQLDTENRIEHFHHNSTQAKDGTIHRLPCHVCQVTRPRHH